MTKHARVGGVSTVQVSGSRSSGSSAASPTARRTGQRALRKAPDGLPEVSGFTVVHVLHEAGFTWQENRTWCDTGVALRKRKEGVVESLP